ncbi:hypothetical protein Lgra_1902 [Legionella gratiana]|uniref:NAD(+)--protein-arginine ADP-ribosyltransferase Tre1-like N-terminal domain-containing protein n=1 Tax=Legionella gratiana TaxID=45066 RepID=A0A378JME9_9GAMM|nr:hypothetical protein [Legionella gratiana]KTD10936.1 hypothetical protein Lgra_1902 [Legionella gratiana]STX45910.1 Uncharacterised protein [Legionella gratiana]
MIDKKASSFYSTGGASVGAAIGGFIGSAVPGLGTVAGTNVGAALGASVGLGFYKLAEMRGFTGVTGVPRMIVSDAMAVKDFLTQNQNQPGNQNTTVNKASNAEQSSLTKAAETIFSEVVEPVLSQKLNQEQPIIESTNNMLRLMPANQDSNAKQSSLTKAAETIFEAVKPVLSQKLNQEQVKQAEQVESQQYESTYRF